MDGDESGLTSYYHHHHHPTTTTTTASAANGVVFTDPHHQQQQQQQQQHQVHNNNNNNNQSTTTTSGGHYSTEPTLHTYPQHHSVPPLASPPPPPPPPPETVKRKRGRPRKYGNPEALQNASPSAKKMNASTSSSSPPCLPSSPRKKDPSFVSTSKKNQLVALGNAGQNFVPHIITVNAGEDVAQKVLSFTQQRKRAVCILSASGSISNAFLRQPAMLGGNVTYEGRFEILSLSGSYLHTETEGGSSRTGGISVCLSNAEGHIIGGAVGGPLKAAGPVQVIVGSFVIDTNKETIVDPKFEISSGKLPQRIGGNYSNVYQAADSPGRIPGRINNDHHNIGVNNYMLQSRGMQSMPFQSTDWRENPDHGAGQSSEDGDDGDLQQ